MNLQHIFSTDEQRAEAIEHFRGLKGDENWLFLVEKLIKADIEEISDEILDPMKEWKPGEEQDAKRRRAYWIILSQLPEKLIDALSEKRDDILIENDPYYTDTKQMIADKRKANKR